MEPKRKVRSYRDLVAWRKAMDLVVLVYQVTRKWSKEESYGLTRQVREAVVSVPSNIAEGQGRNSPREFFQFLGIAYGSLMEMETEILIGGRLDYSPAEEIEVVLLAAGEVGRLLNGLKNSLPIRPLTTDH
jgi:four helix bundle protein